MVGNKEYGIEKGRSHSDLDFIKYKYIYIICLT